MIKQRSWGDCGIAAFMNALFDNNIEHFTYYCRPGGYEEIVESFGRDHGITIQELCAALFEHGFLPVHLPLDGFADASGIKGARSLSRDQLKDTFLDDHRKAIYQVKMKSGVLHFVYFDGHMIWDSLQNSPAYPTWDDYEAVIDVVYLLPNTPFNRHRDFDDIAEYLKDYMTSVNSNGGGFASEAANFMDAMSGLVRSKMKHQKTHEKPGFLGVTAQSNPL